MQPLKIKEITTARLRSLTPPAKTGKSTPTHSKLILHTREETFIIPFEDIMYCKAESNYTMIFLNQGKKLMASKTLKDLEAILPASAFCRTHASFLVNMNFVRRVLRSGKCMIELTQGEMVEVSKSRRQEFMRRVDLL